MLTAPIPSERIRYNAASGMFEVGGTLHPVNIDRTYACENTDILQVDPCVAGAALSRRAITGHGHGWSSSAASLP